MRVSRSGLGRHSGPRHTDQSIPGRAADPGCKEDFDYSCRTRCLAMRGRYVSSMTGQFVEVLGVIGPAAHAIEILRNDRMIGLRQREPIDRLVAVVARICSYSQANLCRVLSLLVHIFNISDNNIRARRQGLVFPG